ncbi:MAG: hypothetical protein K940chlam9_00455 [Chlamydiae bacterium]|nr:hypothetical protein [Chlamydiota bacterium]
MVEPVSPQSIPPSNYQSQSPEEQKKLFSIQFETSVIGIYLSVHQMNGNLEHQNNAIKKGAKGGQDPEQLSPQINQLIDQINQAVPENPTLPSFHFASSGNEQAAISGYAHSLSSILQSTVPAQASGTIAQLNTLASQVEKGQIPTPAALDQLNQLIGQTNQALPPAFDKVPNLP